MSELDNRKFLRPRRNFKPEFLYVTSSIAMGTSVVSDRDVIMLGYRGQGQTEVPKKYEQEVRHYTKKYLGDPLRFQHYLTHLLIKLIYEDQLYIG